VRVTLVAAALVLVASCEAPEGTPADDDSTTEPSCHLGNAEDRETGASEPAVALLELARDAGNPLLDVGEPGAWDDHGVGFMRVIHDGEQYLAYYAGRREPPEDGDSEWRIGLATSLDGAHWTRHPDNPVLDVGEPGSWDDLSVAFPAVHHDGDTYHLWYNARGETLALGYAASSDGIHWERHPDNPVLTGGDEGAWDHGAIGHPAIAVADGIFHLYYMAPRPDPRLGLATSTDGVTWTKHPDNPVFTGLEGSWDAGGIKGTGVTAYEDRFELFYSAREEGAEEPARYQVGHAWSHDGVQFQRTLDGPLLSPGPEGAWDDHAIMTPDGHWFCGRYVLWYDGSDGDSWRIGACGS